MLHADPVCSEPKLFVGGLRFEISREEVVNLFQQFGPLKSCVLLTHKDSGKPKGCAMVLFEKWAHAEAALEATNGAASDMSKPRPLIVKFADPQRRPEDGNLIGVTPKKLFIGQIPRGITPEQIRSICGPYGEIVDLNIMTPKRDNAMGCAFVTYATWAATEAAIEALNGTFTFPGAAQPILVKLADAKAQDMQRVGAKRGMGEMMAGGPAKRQMMLGGNMGNMGMGGFNMGMGMNPMMMQQMMQQGMMPGMMGQGMMNPAMMGMMGQGQGGAGGQAGNQGWQSGGAGAGGGMGDQGGQSGGAGAGGGQDGSGGMSGGMQNFGQGMNMNMPMGYGMPGMNAMGMMGMGGMGAMGGMNPMNAMGMGMMGGGGGGAGSGGSGGRRQMGVMGLGDQNGNLAAAKAWKLFIGQISFDLAEGDLFPFFSQFGSILELVLLRNQGDMRHKGCGFVVYSSAAEAEAALAGANGATMPNDPRQRHITVKYANGAKQ